MFKRFPAPSPLIQILLLWIAGLTAAMQFAKFSLTFSIFREIYPNAGTNLALAVSLIGFIGIICGLFGGLVVSRFGYKKMLVTALLFGAVCSLYQTSLPSFNLLIFSRVLEGISHLIIVVAAPTLIASISPKQNIGAAMTLWSTFFGVAFAITSWIGLPLMQEHGVEFLFQIHSIFMLTIALCIWLFLPNPEKRERKYVELNLKFVLQAHRKVYSSPFQSAPAFGWLFYTLTYVSLLTVLPDFFIKETRDTFLGFLPVVSIITSLFCGAFLLPKFKATKILISSFMLAAMAIGLFWSGLSIETVSLLLFSILGIIQSANFALIPQLNNDITDQANANGAVAQMGNLGNTVGTPILLYVLTVLGINGLIAAIAIIYLGGALAHYVLMKHRHRVKL